MSLIFRNIGQHYHYRSQRFHSVLPVKMAYERFGSNKNCRTNPLIIGHGLFGQKRNWRSLSKALQNVLGNQIYVIDFRNHGDSPHTETHSYDLMSADLEAFIGCVQNETGFNSLYLLGHSMGGKAMAHFALNSSNANKVIKKLIIEDIAPHRPTSDTLILKYIRAMRDVDLSKSRREIENELRPFIQDNGILHFLMMNLARDENNPDRSLWKVNLEAIEKSLEHIFEFQTMGVFSKPTLFVAGGLSHYITKNDYSPLSKFFPNCEFSVIPNAGHWVHVEQPKLFLDCVSDFLCKE